MNISVIGQVIYSRLTAQAKGKEVAIISALDARLPSVTTKEMKETGKSAARLRVEKGINSPIDWLEVKLEDLISKSGRER